MRTRNVLLSLLLLSALLAGGVSFYASSSPDGLERVASDTGLDELGRDHDLAGSPLADYGVAGVGDERLSVGIAGLVGVAITFAVTSTLVLVLRRRGAEAPR